MPVTDDAPKKTVGKLDNVPVDKIRPNPENPRLFFRPAELDTLQQSIQDKGVLVPISVYKDGAEYFLIDGERRWRCASKLNLDTIPALVQPKPEPLDNLLLMYNIHALREQWDTLTVALKLPTINKLLAVRLGREPTEADLAEATGQPRGMIRKCRLLTALPKKHQNVLLHELKKPKAKQEIGEEFYLEMEKSLKVITRILPKALQDIDEARDKLLAKRRAGQIVANIDFRKLSKMARAATPDVFAAVTKAIRKVVNDESYSIDQAWEATVSSAVAEHDIVVRTDALLAKLNELSPDRVDVELREKLEELAERLQQLLGAEGD
jgi:ParB/RepB/Spo0J family partition protein